MIKGTFGVYRYTRHGTRKILNTFFLSLMKKKNTGIY